MASRFSIPLQALADKTKADLELLARKSTFDLFRLVIQRSPVDTGRFKANWNVSYGAPSVTIGGRLDATPKGSWDSATKSQAEKTATLPIGGVTYVANGLPYAYELEKGGSKQAPLGMVGISAIEFSDAIRKALAS